MKLKDLYNKLSGVEFEEEDATTTTNKKAENDAVIVQKCYFMDQAFKKMI